MKNEMENVMMNGMMRKADKAVYVPTGMLAGEDPGIVKLREELASHKPLYIDNNGTVDYESNSFWSVDKDKQKTPLPKGVLGSTFDDLMEEFDMDMENEEDNRYQPDSTTSDAKKPQLVTERNLG